MQPQFVQQKAEQSTSSVASFTSTSMTVTEGNAIVACMCASMNGTLTTTDNNGGKYTQSVIKNNATNAQSVSISSATGCRGGATTFTVTPQSSSFCSISAQEYSGLALVHPDDGTTNSGEATSLNVNPGAVNPPNLNDLYVAAWVHNGSASQTFTYNVSGEGWTARANLTNTTREPLGSQDFIGSGSKTGSATISSGPPVWDAVVATFRAGIARTLDAHRPAPFAPSATSLGNF